MSCTPSDPIFLVGAERSGTTLLRLMLDHHPMITWCNEFEYSVDLMADRESWPPLDRYYQWLETHRIFLNTGFVIDYALDYPQLVDSFLRQRQKNTGKVFIGATVHRHFDLLLKIWPNSRFIHLVRDGRDVAISNISMGWAGNVWTGSVRWLHAEELWRELVKIVPDSRRINIIYESLVAEPVWVLNQLCDFIGVPFDNLMLTYPQNTTYDLPSKIYAQQWKTKLSKHEIQLIESRIGTMLADLGYELSEHPAINISYPSQQILRLQDWWYRLTFRIKRYGLPVFILDYILRSFNLRWLSKKVQIYINSINNKYLK